MPSNLWEPGQSGNPAGRLRGSRNKLSEEVICALLRDFREHGQKAIAKVRREQPGVYLRCLTLLIPREHKVEQSNVIKNLSDQQIEDMIEYIENSLAAQAGRSVKLIEGTIEPTAVEATAPPALEPPKPKSRLMLAADTAVRPRERKPRKVSSPAGT
jgi:16S rRNA C967 or C1407 C5-methylase (RsmB/RsmF family)